MSVKMVFAKLVLHVRIKFTEDKRKRYVLAVIINGVIVLFVTLIALSTKYSKVSHDTDDYS